MVDLGCVWFNWKYLIALQVFWWIEKPNQLEIIFPLIVKYDKFWCKMNYTSIFLHFISSLRTKEREREERRAWAQTKEHQRAIHELIEPSWPNRAIQQWTDRIIMMGSTNANHPPLDLFDLVVIASRSNLHVHVVFFIH